MLLVLPCFLNCEEYAEHHHPLSDTRMVHFADILIPVTVVAVLCGVGAVLACGWKQYQARKLEEEKEQNKMEEEESNRVFSLRPVSTKQ